MSVIKSLFVLFISFIVANAFTGNRLMSLNARKYAKISKSSTNTLFYKNAVHNEVSAVISNSVDDNSKGVHYRQTFSTLYAKERKVNKITRESEDEFFESNVSLC